ncbi:divalent anion:Na symporter (DASS) family protein [Thraustotheca clavata]|uniref:Divalent anion:Na symporter (DASS) family protein n=1 Tax=Thraustotheca clavata TaxID=74557 RepID=A0A1V9YTV6_9STRA|nr:divalent anion:Na symporter (DASS) family protein [Thraustotheca clavata]
MKFGKQLELTANVEWRQHYVQYKKLKRLIKRVAFEIERGKQKQEKIEKKRGVSPPNLPRPSHIEATSSKIKAATEASPLLTSSTLSSSDLNVEGIEEAKKEFWEMTNANIQIANDFYRAKITSIAKNIKDFESMLRDEGKTAHGHVSTHYPTFSHEADRGFAAIQDAYDTLIDLKAFVNLNHTGFRKIVKKFDKTAGENALESFMRRLNREDFYASNDIDGLLDRLFSITSKDKLEAGNMEGRIRRQQGNQDSLFRKVKFVPFTVSCTLFLILLMVRLPGEASVEQRCLAMLVFVTSLWVTEAVPYFATSLLVPVLVVFLRILNDKRNPDTLLDAKSAAKEAMTLLVNHTTILIMGGFSISAALSKCQIELYLAAFLQRRFKKRPRLFLLAIMLMGLFLSMWINNHTAPVLCVSVLLPIIRDFPHNSSYVKTLLIGLAFACNLGGMMTPIASLQNTLAQSYLEKAGYIVSFGEWMMVSVPFCTFSTVLCWLFLLWIFDPSDVKYIPQIVYDQKQRINRVHVAVVVLTLLTITLWALFTFMSETIGDMGIISLMLMFTLFGTGILSQFDFNSFSWHILFLIAGGNVLGEAVQRSGLLITLSHSLIQALPSGSVWLTTIMLSLLVLCLTTFISHTVASLILLPIIVQLSVEIGHPHIPVICCSLAISAAMGLPFASFPNINSLLVLDDHGEPYLKVQDFLRVGLIFSIFTVLLIVTLGYTLIIAVLGYTLAPVPLS